LITVKKTTNDNLVLTIYFLNNIKTSK